MLFLTKRNIHQKGFTLIEILLVVAAIAILAGIVILAINPSKQLGDTRNSARHADVTTILNAVYQYAVDHDGTLPVSITTTSKEICAGDVATSTCSSSNLASLKELVWNQRYLTAIPIAPQAPVGNGTGYFIVKTADNRITVTAPNAEENATISVTR
jgi:prepilin-type N-terminal cleavage/methylation domain-containing protein